MISFRKIKDHTIIFALMNRNPSSGSLRRLARHQEANICPSCNLLKNTYSFIDPVLFTYNTICNDCRNEFLQSVASKYNLTYSATMTTSSRRGISKSKLKQSYLQMALQAIPHSTWSAVTPQKAQKLKNVYKAKLVFHRYYSCVSPSSLSK